jgi:hypothetical protein
MHFNLEMRVTRAGYSIDLICPATSDLIYSTRSNAELHRACLDLADWYWAYQEAEASFSHGEAVQ